MTQREFMDSIAFNMCLYCLLFCNVIETSNFLCFKEFTYISCVYLIHIGAVISDKKVCNELRDINIHLDIMANWMSVLCVYIFSIALYPNIR